MFSYVSSFYLEAVPIDRCSELMKFNETCSSWLISQYGGSSNDKRKGFYSYDLRPWTIFLNCRGCIHRKIPEEPSKMVPGHIRSFLKKCKDNKT